MRDRLVLEGADSAGIPRWFGSLESRPVTGGIVRERLRWRATRAGTWPTRETLSAMKAAQKMGQFSDGKRPLPITQLRVQRQQATSVVNVRLATTSSDASGCAPFTRNLFIPSMREGALGRNRTDRARAHSLAATEADSPRNQPKPWGHCPWVRTDLRPPGRRTRRYPLRSRTHHGSDLLHNHDAGRRNEEHIHHHPAGAEPHPRPFRRIRASPGALYRRAPDAVGRNGLTFPRGAC